MTRLELENDFDASYTTYHPIHAKFRRNTRREYFIGPEGNMSAPFVVPPSCLKSLISASVTSADFAIIHVLVNTTTGLS